MSRAQLRELGHEKFYDALFDGLQELGYVEGRNLIVPRVCGGDGSTECRRNYRGDDAHSACG